MPYHYFAGWLFYLFIFELGRSALLRRWAQWDLSQNTEPGWLFYKEYFQLVRKEGYKAIEQYL